MSIAIVIFLLQIPQSHLQGLLKVWNGSQEFAFLTNCHNADATGPGVITLRVTVLEDDFKITSPNPPNYSHSTSNQSIISLISLIPISLPPVPSPHYQQLTSTPHPVSLLGLKLFNVSPKLTERTN